MTSFVQDVKGPSPTARTLDMQRQHVHTCFKVLTRLGSPLVQVIVQYLYCAVAPITFTVRMSSL